MIEKLLAVKCEASTRIPTQIHGEYRLFLYSNSVDKIQHLAIVFGGRIRSESLDAASSSDMDRIIMGTLPLSEIPEFTSYETPILTRIHSSCFTGETILSSRCDCADQLYDAMSMMNTAGEGVIVYLIQEGRGIGLLDKLRAYNLQDLGHDTVNANILLSHPPDARSYSVASLILQDLRISSIKLLTNNPEKIAALERDGIKIIEHIPMIPRHWQAHATAESLVNGKKGTSGAPTNNKELDGYIITKVERMNHILQIPDRFLNKA